MSERHLRVEIGEVVVYGHDDASEAQIEAEVRAGIRRALATGGVPREWSQDAALLRAQRPPRDASHVGDLGEAIVTAQAPAIEP